MFSFVLACVCVSFYTWPVALDLGASSNYLVGHAFVDVVTTRLATRAR